MRQRDRAKTLEEDVLQLRPYIPALEIQRNRLIYQKLWDFRFGVKPEDDLGFVWTGILVISGSSHQLAFMCSFLIENVALDENCEVVDRQYSSSFKGLQLQLKRIQRVISDQFMSVPSVLNVPVSAVTLEKIARTTPSPSILAVGYIYQPYMPGGDDCGLCGCVDKDIPQPAGCGIGTRSRTHRSALQV
ncbi:LOW QUALITY PROTEIN: hypothetical protein PHPALM_28780 [Phytophthora palmivora]|uniref:Uncharacterized protein n=1 Tax=Phytophthora palmivora TaxID=4796 RepID=A0A2P4X974_9STRA|nr:LOW QUALITY PROTEIN: hypothetical protein PHPALM_28780 [Phytophthora palmivora]